MEAITIKAYTNDNEHIEAVKAVLKAFKIKFDVTKEKPYNPEFIAKIKRGDAQVKKGKFTTVSANEIDNYIASL